MPTWDESKRTANLAKHGVDFAIVAGFDWDTAVIEIDRDVEGEQRLRALGWIGATLYFLVYADVTITTEAADGTTQTVETIRVISLRTAEKSEYRRYDKETR